MSALPILTATATRAVIFGCAGHSLSDAERRFFKRCNPVGLILFARNCRDPDQVRALVDDFKHHVDNDEPLILIDQEGGRVQRLRPPHWLSLPAAGKIAELGQTEIFAAESAAHLLGRLLASELAPLGITVDCAPVLDLLHPETHEMIADRTFGDHPDQVARLGRAVCDGLLKGGVLPVIKHLPGHGRARVDSHHELPVVDTSLAELRRTDFVPFRALAHMPLAMSAHVVFAAIDPNGPVSTSKLAFSRAIRGALGYGGVVISDDIGMQALDGDMAARARACQQAGCDLVLHCSGDLDEMEAVAEVVRPTRKITASWLARAAELRHQSASKMPFDRDAALSELAELLGEGAPVPT